MNKNLIKKLIILFCIIIIVIIIAIIIFRNSAGQIFTENDGSDNSQKNSSQIDKEIVANVEEKEREYMIEQCVSSYLDIINTNSSSYYGYDENGNFQKIINEDVRILNVLSKEYINENNITKDNVSNYIQKLDTDVFFVPLQINYINKGNLYKYAISGYVADLDYNFIKNVAFIVNLDMTGTKSGTDSTYSIEPINEEIDNIEKIQLNNTLESIESNDDNNIRYIISNSEENSKRYLDNYKKMALSNPEEAYNHLDEEYRDKRFGSLEAFEKYVNDNRDFLISLQPQKYLLNNYNKYKEYVCMDKYNNLYIFREYGLLDYNILLDTYTILTDNFKNTYDSSDVEEKVNMNIDKWIKMLNNRDYTAAYNCLDETFRNNNFGSEEVFEQYMRANFPLHYKLEVGQVTESNGIYTQDIVLTDIAGESSDKINKTIIMQLGENYEFKMSFNVDDE